MFPSLLDWVKVAIMPDWVMESVTSLRRKVMARIFTPRLSSCLAIRITSSSSMSGFQLYVYSLRMSAPGSVYRFKAATSPSVRGVSSCGRLSDCSCGATGRLSGL